MTKEIPGERKKLSLSLEGKLSLKNSVNSKLAGSVTTNTRSGRNTVQVEVKRVKRSIDVKEVFAKKQKELSGTLSAEEISSRSKQLKEGLARTAAEAVLARSGSEDCLRGKLSNALLDLANSFRNHLKAGTG